ncbi:TetR/AcrR family transcriptional regulator [Nocardioides sp. WS12]|uniref:TetR/AcrR family transcriptional regulator n=1 Tax=Nocardioides sp. WS12 TaxID=2486272 RepID=UPI0015FCD01D|nr:TetR/AcrR family transcriptional regulator [Nocardioides sp. WS12]
MRDALSRAVASVADAVGTDGDDGHHAPEVHAILDAALAQCAEFGIKRTTIGDIARRAGIDRVTVYRRIGNKEQVIQAVVTREATRLFLDVAATARRGTTLAERVELGFTSMMQQVRGHAMLARMLQVEPETVLLQLTTEGSVLVTGATVATLGFFGEAVEDGLLETTEGMEADAELLVRVVHSYLLTPRALIELDSPEQLNEFARRHLVPMVLRGRAAR